MAKTANYDHLMEQFEVDRERLVRRRKVKARINKFLPRTHQCFHGGMESAVTVSLEAAETLADRLESSATSE